ncbi:MAG TPA: hypothetical protein VMV69_27275 [Pirellulales bacterium]|nr:hypothetical protein [Pirellulales bacterium]
MDDNDRAQSEHSLRQDFELTLANRIDRSRRTRVHPAIPSGYFSVASTECRDVFVDGHFYGCITLVQSVAEGLAKFLATNNGITPNKNHLALVNALQKHRSNPVISPQAYAAFRTIRGGKKEDRNT